MLGSGIFVLPGIATAKTGESIWLAYLCAAICIIPAVLSKSELATAMPKSGGAYVYIERAFGPLFGTISGIGLWLSLLLKSAFALVGFGAYLSIIINTGSLKIQYISIFFLSLIMILNILGVKKVGKVQLVTISISLLGLISLLILGIQKSEQTASVNNFLLNGTTGLISTIAFVYISYAGVTKIAAIAGEVKNPRKNLPTAMILSLLLISIIYVLTTYVLSKNIPAEELSNNAAPLYLLANLLGGQVFAYIISIIGIITLISMANSGVLASSRFPFAMAQDKLLPTSLTKVHKKYLTPVNTIIMTSIIMAIVILFLDIEKIAKLASAFKVCMFISVNLCVIILRETSVQWYIPKYKSPLYPYMQLFGIISGLILLFYLGLMPILTVIGIGIIGCIIYFVYGKKSSRSGVLINYGHIPALFFFFKKRYHLKKSRIINTHNQKKENNEFSILKKSTIITFLGNERSPQILTEIGCSLTKEGNTQVINITEVPDQTALEGLHIDKKKIQDLQRQTKYLANKYQIPIYFQPICTHNVSKTIQSISANSKLKWLVLEWNGKASNGILINNPVGWIVSNINSNFALFKDNGIKYFSKILLAIRPNSKDLEYLINTASNIAKFYNVGFSVIQIISENTEEKEKLISKLKNQLSKYSSLIQEIKIEESNNPIQLISDVTLEYDLLILGTPRKDTWKTMLFGTGEDPIATQANCSVLRLTIKNL